MVPRFSFYFQQFAGLPELQRHCRNFHERGGIANQITHEYERPPHSVTLRGGFVMPDQDTPA